MPDINLGDNYSIDEDSNGDLIIRHDPSGDEIKYDSANNGFVGDNFNSVNTEYPVHEPTDGSSHHYDSHDSSRPLVTREPVTLYCDPVNGDDTNSGTQDQPIETLSEAFGRVPFFVHHQFIIDLYTVPMNNGDLPVTYGGTKPFMAGMTIVGNQPHIEPFLIKGDPNDRTNVTIDTNIEMNPTSPEVDDASIRDLTITGSLRNSNGDFKVQNVLFTGTNSSIIENEWGKHAFTNHEHAYTQFNGCRFESPVGAAIFAADGSKVLLNRCEGLVDDYAIVGERGARISVASDGGLAGKKGYYNINTGSRLTTADGKHRPADLFLSDMWDDGRLQNRISSTQKSHRPEWDVIGSVSAGNGFAEFPAGDTTTQYLTTSREFIKMVNGDWDFDFEPQSDPTAGTFDLYFMRQNTDDFFRLRVKNGGSVELEKFDGGASTTLLTAAGQTIDANSHNVRVSRREDIDGNGNEGFEVFYDGNSLGTATESFIPSDPNGWDVRFISQFDAAVRLQNLALSKAT